MRAQSLVLRTVVALAFLALCAVRGYPQFNQVPVGGKKSAPLLISKSATPVAVSNLDATHDFGTVDLRTVSLWNIELTLNGNDSVAAVDIQDINNAAEQKLVADPSPEFKSEHPCEKEAGGSCSLVVGFMPTVAAAATTAKLDVRIHTKGTDSSADQHFYSILTGTGGAATTSCLMPDRRFLPTSLPSYKKTGGEATATDLKVIDDFGAWANGKESAINCYFQMNGPVGYLTQFQSIYNAAASSATVSADVASLNFNNGTQLTLGTNIQAKSTDSPTPATTTTSTSPVPTLSSASAAQAAQNLLWGGNVWLYGVWPIFYNPNSSADRWQFDGVLSAREGVDVQNFTGASTTAANPSTHFNVQGEGYWEYDAIPASNSGGGSAGSAPVSPGSIFVGGRYGFSYNPNAYARQYGFKANKVAIAQLTFGVLVNGTVKVAVSRAFGPLQTYVDSTTSSKTTVNNFQTWSFAIAYQSKTPSNTKQ